MLPYTYYILFTYKGVVSSHYSHFEIALANWSRQIIYVPKSICYINGNLTPYKTCQINIEVAL